MATPEQVQELVGDPGHGRKRSRRTCKAADATCYSAESDDTVGYTQQQAATTAMAGGGQQQVGTVDTRALGKPEVFEGNGTKWHDFR
eukprot:5611150-Amphidinium_carterae.1